MPGLMYIQYRKSKACHIAMYIHTIAINCKNVILLSMIILFPYFLLFNLLNNLLIILFALVSS
jgi:hypothetical protein